MSGTPLSIASLVQVLQHATSSSPAYMALAHQQLSDWELEGSSHSTGGQWREGEIPTEAATQMASESIWGMLLAVAREPRLELDRAALQAEAGGAVLSEADVTRREEAVKQAAAIRFKNAVNKYWRKGIMSRGTASVPKSLKHGLRELLLHSTLLAYPLSVPNSTFAQLSLCIARVARHDFPSEWPNLFDFLMKCMGDAYEVLLPGGVAQPDGQWTQAKAEATYVLYRSADALARCLKELESVRILAGKIRITELARSMMPTLHSIFHTYFNTVFTESLAQAAQPDTLQHWASVPMVQEKLKTSVALLKAARILSVADMGTLTRNASSEGGAAANSALAFFRSIPNALQRLVDVRRRYLLSLGQADAPLAPELSRLLLGFGKYYLALIRKEKTKAPNWDGWSEVVLWYWVRAQEADDATLNVSRDELASPAAAALITSPRFVAQALVIFKLTLLHWKNSPPDASPLMTADFARSATDALVGRFLRLNRDDLERWTADPEEFEIGEEAETYEVEIRRAAERAIIALAKHCRPRGAVIERLWERWNALEQSQAGAGLEAVLERDATLAAMGLCWDLFPEDSDDEAYVDLGGFVSTSIVSQGSVGSEAGPNWLIVRRRVAWFLDRWSEHIDAARRPPVYGLIAHLLSEQPGQTDAAVRLAAAKSLSGLVDAVEFQPDHLEPHLRDILQSLAHLLGASDLCLVESLRTCTRTLSIVIERMGPRCAPHVEAIASLIPPLWEAEDPEFKAKPAIIILLSKLVRSVELLPDQSSPAHRLQALVEPVVRSSLHPNVSLMLGKDALQLWLRALRSSNSMSEPLFRLLDLVPDLVRKADFCPEACRIIEESCLLAAREVVSHCGLPVFRAMAAIIADPTSPMILSVVGAVDTAIQALERAGARGEGWPALLEESGLSSLLIGSLLKVEDSVIISTYIVALLARICIFAPPGAFHEMLRSAALRLGHAETELSSVVHKPLVTLWCHRSENMSSPRRRKVACLGLAALLRHAQPNRDRQIFAELAQMIAVWSDALADVKEDDKGDAEAYHRPASPANSLAALSDDGDWLEDTAPGVARLSSLADEDPVLRIRLGTAITEALGAGQAALGPQLFDGIDPLVLDMLQADLKAA